MKKQLYKAMKKYTLLLLLFGFFVQQGRANNLIIGAPTASGNTISFTIQWDNSWYVPSGPSNWDAIWVFVKRQHCDANTQTGWMHETLNSTAANQTVTGSQLQVDLATSDNLGVFVRRSAAGIGNIAQCTVTLTLSTPVNQDNIAVYGIEMVYVPEGQFYIGDGATQNSFADGAGHPLLVTKAMQDAGIGSASNYGGLGSDGSLPATFPLGYYGYYCMKKEITCKLYCDFLNSLTYTQQIYLLDNPNAAPPVASPGDKINSRYGYNIEVVSQNALQPAVYGCDATDDNNWNQANDGLEVPVCLRTQNLLAFLDWAALRPMTEFEFEKACRGPVYPVPNEYAWGTTDQSSDYTIVNQFQTNEYSSTAPLGLSNMGGGGSELHRAGIEATSTSDRVHAGASYYGILNLTGSTSERCVGGWGYDYSGFTAINGNGNITNQGTTNIIGWPIGEYNYVFRGGSLTYWGKNSSRDVHGDWNYSDPYAFAQGGRGVRSF